MNHLKKNRIFCFASIINFINQPTAGESVSDQYGRVGGEIKGIAHQASGS